MPSVPRVMVLGQLGDRQRDVEGDHDEDDADQHGGRDVDQRLDVPFGH
jgi:hypothetical protein